MYCHSLTKSNKIHSHSDPSASYGRISDLFTQLSFPAHVRSSTSGQITTPLKLEERSLESTPGLAVVHRHLSQLLLGPGAHAAYYAALATSPSRGLLLSGPPGVGKTWAVAQACAAAGAELHCVSAADMHSPYPGETEARLRDAFARAAAAAQARSGVVALFLDEIDAIAPVRDASASSTTARAVAQLLTLLDGAAGTDARVVVIAATNRPNAIDPAVRRPGRLDRELVLDPPTAATRADILRALLAKVPVAPNVLSEDWIGRVAECLPGYVGADLAAVVREACRDLMVRVQAHEAECGVSRDDLLRAIKSVPPSLRRGHVVQVQASGSHKTSGWEDIGGLEDVKKKIIQAVVWPLQHAEKFTRLGLRPPHGLLLYGPPGCSKTTLVRVLASELRSAFYTLTPADVYSSLVGDAERTVRAAFARARATSPSILFLDEIDALVGGDRLGSGSDGGGATDDVKSRVLLTLLAEMDGIEDANRRPVLVVAATNHPGKLDAALVRAGRIDRAVYVRPPRADERTAIVQVYTRRMPLHTSVDLAAIAARLEGATGAEIEAVCREAALASLRANADAVTIDHFDAAVRAWRPMVGPEMVQYYEDLALRFK
ncbi:P-loop containing nucleoside triphosphate hydrolase protein [Blastocladiella britannica]|nr:P-loop containing nucleoside triphosphate hydrolase protein [Blastocladiella britannica]